MDVLNLEIDPEYEALCTPLTSEEYESLKDSIQKDGLWTPLIVNPNRVILDGHHRYRICNEVGRPWDDPEPVVKRFSSKLLEKKFVIEINLRRRQLTTLQKVEMAMKIEPIEAELARQRQEATRIKDGKLPSGVQLNTTVKGKARDIVAKKVGLSPTTYHRAKKVLEEAPEELIKWVRDDDWSISRAYNLIKTPIARERIENIIAKAPKKLLENVRKGKTRVEYAYTAVKRAEKHLDPPELPEGIFDVIYANPPWEYAFMTINENPEEQYSTITFDEILNLEVDDVKVQDKIADEAVLFLWATNTKLWEAFDVIEAWGFVYRTNMLWVKNGLGIGHYFRENHELLLLGKKGAMIPPTEVNRLSSVLKAAKSDHNGKPDEVYARIEKMYPNRKYLKLFTRPETRRNGWTYWGDESEE